MSSTKHVKNSDNAWSPNKRFYACPSGRWKEYREHHDKMKKDQINVKPQCKGKVQGIDFLHTSHYLEDCQHSRHTYRRAGVKIMLVLTFIPCLSRNPRRKQRQLPWHVIVKSSFAQHVWDTWSTTRNKTSGFFIW